MEPCTEESCAEEPYAEEPCTEEPCTEGGADAENAGAAAGFGEATETGSQE